MTFYIEDLWRAVKLLEGMQRRLVCHPDNEGAVQAAVDQIPGTLGWVTVTVNQYCPHDKVLVFKATAP